MTDDERISQLQRMAFGADTPDAVRARAAAELAELAAAESGGRMHAARAPRDAAESTDGEHDPRPGGAAAEPSPDPAGSDPSVDDDVNRPRARRWTAIVGVGALLVGAAIGAALARVAPAQSGPAPADIAPTTPAFGSGESGTPLGETLLPRLFDRLPVVAVPGVLERAAMKDIDPASVRLLASRPHGPAAYLARTSDGTDVCLILLVLPADPPQGRCTAGGVMPVEGLRISDAAVRRGSVVAILNASGTVTLGLDARR